MSKGYRFSEIVLKFIQKLIAIAGSHREQPSSSGQPVHRHMALPSLAASANAAAGGGCRRDM